MTRSPDEDDKAAEQARAWLVRLASGEMTAKELAAFETWLGQSDSHERAFETERAFWQRLAPLEATFERLEQAARVPAPGEADAHWWTPRELRKRGALAALAIAACLLLLVFGPEISTALLADYRSGGDGPRSLTLADGSLVTVNRNSAIRVRFSPALRQVELLEGEAFFEVQANPQRPFQVLAEGGVSQALGTAYAVRRGGDGASVAVTEGTVAVTSGRAPERTVSLHAGEGIRYAGGGLGDRFLLQADRALAWRQSKVVFVDCPLAEALRELERYHAGHILLLGEGRAYQPISGIIDLDHLEEGIAALAATHGLAAFQITPFLTVLR